MNTAITRLNTAAEINPHTFVDLEALLAPLDHTDIRELLTWSPQTIAQGWRPEPPALVKYLAESYPRAIAIVDELFEPPLTVFIIAMCKRLMKSKPNASFSSEDYLEILVEEIETSVPKYSTAAIIKGFREIIRTPDKNLPDVGTVLLALDDAKKKFYYTVEPLLKIKEVQKAKAAWLVVLTSDDYKRHEAEAKEKRRAMEAKYGPEPNPFTNYKAYRSYRDRVHADEQSI
jgi:hypothetical protein